jgi:hypothetical protein
VHQFRIEAQPGIEGRPTPKGRIRTGWISSSRLGLVRRENITSGVTTIANAAKEKLGSFTLAEPMDAALVDNHRVLHSTTPITPSTRRNRRSAMLGGHVPAE